MAPCAKHGGKRFFVSVGENPDVISKKYLLATRDSFSVHLRVKSEGSQKPTCTVSDLNPHQLHIHSLFQQKQENTLISTSRTMFKPICTASSLRSVLSKQANLGSRFGYCRNVSASPRSRTSFNLSPGNRKTITATIGLLGGLAICQWASGMEVHAEAPPAVSTEDLKRKLSVQHIQVC